MIRTIPVDLDAVDLLFRDPRQVVDRKLLGAYKITQPQANQRIIDCYDIPRIFNDLFAELRASREALIAADELPVDLSTPVGVAALNLYDRLRRACEQP